jgi:hypothetical protein
MIKFKRKNPISVIIGFGGAALLMGFLHFLDSIFHFMDSLFAFFSELNFFQGFFLYCLFFGVISGIYYGLNHLYQLNKPENVKERHLESYETLIDDLRSKFRNFNNSQKIRLIVTSTEKMTLNSIQIASLINCLDEDVDRFKLIELVLKKKSQIIDREILIESMSFKKGKAILIEYLEQLE